MEHVTVLLGTILWVGLIGGIVWRFNKPIESLLSALTKRIDTGSDIEVGPFKMTKDLSPQLPQEQAERVKEEYEAEKKLLPPPETDTAVGEHKRPIMPIFADFQEQFFQAEDLALRELQAMFGVPLNRQVKGPNGHKLDAAFLLNGTIHLVEVKLTSGANVERATQDMVEQLKLLPLEQGWRRVTLVVVLVAAHSAEYSVVSQALNETVINSPFPVIRIAYDLEGLRRSFGGRGTGV